MKTQRTQSAIARGYGSARTGTGHFIMQRMTALILPPLMLLSLYFLMQAGAMPYAQAQDYIGHNARAAVLAATVLVMLYHMSLGLQVVIEDYVSTHMTRVLMIIAVRASALLMGAVALTSLFSLI